MKLDFYRGRRVLVTGHTGFKGAWLCGLLGLLGAETAGYALPPAEPSLYTVLGLERELRSVMGDIRDPDPLEGSSTRSGPRWSSTSRPSRSCGRATATPPAPLMST